MYASTSVRSPNCLSDCICVYHCVCLSIQCLSITKSTSESTRPIYQPMSTHPSSPSNQPPSHTPSHTQTNPGWLTLEVPQKQTRTERSAWNALKSGSELDIWKHDQPVTVVGMSSSVSNSLVYGRPVGNPSLVLCGSVMVEQEGLQVVFICLQMTKVRGRRGCSLGILGRGFCWGVSCE